jgi:L,D-transpeptidase YbiS
MTTAGKVAAALTALVLLAGTAACRIASLGGWYVLSSPRFPEVDAGPAAAAAAAAAARRLEERLAASRPRGIHLVVDTYSNRLRVYRGSELLRDTVCSTGSGVVLRDPSKPREWIFDTPRGERRVVRKVRDPVWFKPDWAFIEEGFEPPKDSRERVDDISLGRYGLYLGDGYIIHGTLFQTLLGQRVTHGCIRLGDADLEYVYENVPVGARVFLY